MTASSYLPSSYRLRWQGNLQETKGHEKGSSRLYVIRLFGSSHSFKKGERKRLHLTVTIASFEAAVPLQQPGY